MRYFFIVPFLILFFSTLQSNIYAEDWITEEVLKQLTEVRQELKLLKGEISILNQEVKNIRLNEGRGANNRKPKNIVGSVELGDLPRLGSKDSSVVIVEFSDFQCPFCSRHHKQTMPLIKTNYLDTGKIQYVPRDFPLNFHSKARGAAIAVRCAAKQSDSAYWTMHDELFEKGSVSLNKESYNSIATKLRLDMNKFVECLGDKSITKLIDDDMAYAQQLGVSGTPAFFIGKFKDGKIVNARRLVGAQPYSNFSRIFDYYLNNDEKSLDNIIRK